MTAAEENYRLLQEIDANRQFLLLAMQSNPAMLEAIDEHIRQMFGPFSAVRSRDFIPPAPIS